MFNILIWYRIASVFSGFVDCCYTIWGQYRNAITEYSKAFEHSPQDEELYYKIAKCYNKNGECDKAVAEYENYLKIDTKNEASNIYIEIAFMFIENNRFNDALLFFNKFVNIACDNQKNT